MKHDVGRVMATAAKGVWVQIKHHVDFYVFQGKHLNQERYPCALGDMVEVDLLQKSVVNILLRKNLLIRKRREKSDQLVVSDVSCVVLCVTFLKDRLHVQFVDRVVAGLMQQHIPVVILITKKDLLDDRHLEWLKHYQDYMHQYAFHKVIALDTRDPEQVEELVDSIDMQPDFPLVACMGPSGAGKSTLIQTVSGQTLLSSEVNQKTGKGRHTTTQPQLYTWDDKYLADCPGIKTWFPNTAHLLDCFQDLLQAPEGFTPTEEDIEEFCKTPSEGAIADYWKHCPNEGHLVIGKQRYNSYFSILDESHSY